MSPSRKRETSPARSERLCHLVGLEAARDGAQLAGRLETGHRIARHQLSNDGPIEEPLEGDEPDPDGRAGERRLRLDPLLHQAPVDGARLAAPAGEVGE